MRSPDWQKPFYGRKDELAVLMHAWSQATGPNPRPQFVLLLADSGLGKTRILHEFYHQISIEENGPEGDGYWPDHLCEDFQSMRVNPEVCNPARTIPWLWWGLRWAQRIGKNVLQRNEASSDGLRGSLAELEAHAFPLIKKRNLRHAADSFAWSSVQLASSLFPLASFATHAMHWLNEIKELAEATESGRHLWQHYKAIFEGKAHAESPEPAYQPIFGKDVQKSLSDRAFDFARGFLDTSVKELPTVPLVLVLDDAQEADPTSLDFAEKLYREAVKGGWPLLVIATHWERNWKLHEDQILAEPPGNDPPGTFFHLVERLFQGENLNWRHCLARGDGYVHPCFHPILVGKLDECADILALAYPGLGEPAHAHILSIANGNPKILTDFLRLVSSKLGPNRWCWENGSTDGDLTPEGLTRLLGLPVKHEDIFALFIDDVRAMEPGIIAALSVSSHQGIQFLHELTEAVSQELGHPPIAQIQTSLLRADNPHNLIAPLPQVRVPASEFREAIMCRIFKEQHPDLSPQTVEKALRAVLLRWLLDGQMSAHPEAGHLYRCLLTLLEDADARSDLDVARVKIRALGEYFVWLQRRWEFQPAALQLARLDALASSLVEDGRPIRKEVLGVARESCARAEGGPGGACLADVPFDIQVAIIENGFLFQTNYAAALRWCDSLLAQLPAKPQSPEELRQRYVTSNLRADAYVRLHGARRFAEAKRSYCDAIASIKQLRWQYGDSRRSLRDEAASLSHLGDLELAEGDRVGARAHLAESLKLIEEIRRQYGDSPQVLWDELFSLAMLGAVAFADGDRARAKARFAQSLKLSQEIRRQFGNRPDALREEAGSLARLGDIELTEGDRAGAKARFAESLKLNQEIRRQFGKSPQISRDESLILVRLGAVAFAEGNRAEAKTRFAESLKLDQETRRQFGDSPEALRNESVSLGRLGDVELAEGDRAGAKARHEQSLKLNQEIRRRFGDTPEALRDESVTLGRIGDLELADGDRARAKARFAESLRLSREIRRQFGDSPQALWDEAVSLGRLGDLELAEGDRAGAKARFASSLRLSQEIRRQFGDTPQALRGEAASLGRLGGLELAEGGRAGAKAHFAESLRLNQEIRRQFGNSPEALRDEAASLGRLGDLEGAEGDRAGAKAHYAESLRLNQEIRRQFGDSPEALRDEAVSLARLGDLELAEGDRSGANAHLAKSLKLNQEIRRQFGDSPEALRDEAVSLGQLGDLELAGGDRSGAKVHFAEGLKLHQEIRRQFGDSPEALRDEATSLGWLGQMDLAEGDRAGAKTHFAESLRLNQEVRRQFGDSPQALRDEAVSLGRLGELELTEGHRAGAKARFAGSLRLSQEIRRQFGDSPQALRGEAASLGRLGDVALAEEDRAGAKAHFAECLKLNQEIRRQFGDNPEVLRDEAISQSRLALTFAAGEAWAHAADEIEPAIEIFSDVLKRYGSTPDAMQDYLWAVRCFIEWCEKSGQPQRAEPLRELLASAPPDA